MSTIQEIETAVTQLSPEQLADFRAWFAEYEALRDLREERTIAR